MCRDSSVGRASDWRSEGPWFDPGSRQSFWQSFSKNRMHFTPIYWCLWDMVLVAQWIARWISNPKVPGSNPGWDIFFLEAHCTSAKTRIESLAFSHGSVWLSGLGVWFSLWVREVPGSNPGWAHTFQCILKTGIVYKMDIANVLTYTTPWCSGYHICLTRRRSPVRAWAVSVFIFLKIFFNHRKKMTKIDSSHTGNRTRAFRVRAGYPNH